MGGSNHRCISCVLLGRFRYGPFSYTAGAHGSTGVCTRLDLENVCVRRVMANRLIRESGIGLVLNRLFKRGYCSWCSIRRLEPPIRLNVLCRDGFGGAASNTRHFSIDFLSAGHGELTALDFYCETVRVRRSYRYRENETLTVAFRGLKEVGSLFSTARGPLRLPPIFSAVRRLLFTSGRPWAYPATHETVVSVSDRCAAWVGGIGLPRRIELFN